jgi:ComF family protein
MSAVLQTLSSLGRESARIVLHATCVACDAELPWRDRTASCCNSCWSSLPRITSAKCDSCALPWSGEGEDGAAFRCIDCMSEPLPVAWCDAWGHYRGALESVLHAMKFERHDFFAEPLSGLLAETLRDADFDAIVPVPMHRSKLRRRGYNQAELLARELAKRVGVKCEPALLTRRAERATQSKLTRIERRVNVRGAFAANPRAKGRSILIVDDVCTTGETLRACAAVLANEEASRVCAIVVAKA